jgi:OPA family glycerol-3-phosphate transporter-like MFS transporter
MYAFFYMSRYNFSAVGAAISSDFGWSDSDYGAVVSAGLFVYGCAVFLNGPLADRIGGKRAILFGAAGAALFNLLFGLGHLLLLRPAALSGGQVVRPAELAYGMANSTVVAMFAVLWACNYYFQSFGALSVVKINAAWFRISERGKFVGIFGIMIQGGRTLAFTLLPLSLKFVPWQYAFFIPSLLLGVMWLVCYLGVQNAPASCGYPELDPGDESPEEAQAPPTLGFVLRKVFARPEPWIIAFSSMCIGMVRHSIDHWYSKYFVAVFAIDARALGGFAPFHFASIAMPMAAVFGGVVGGYASDRLFQSRRAPVICIAFLGQALCLLMLRFFIRQPWMASLALVLISLCINSAHALVGGASSMDFGGRKAVATAAGLFDGAQYLAGSLSGIGMGWLFKRFASAAHPGAQYDVWPLAPLGFALLGALIISRLWHALPGRSRHSHLAAAAATLPPSDPQLLLPQPVAPGREG